MNEPHAPYAGRVAAAEALLDRGWDKPKQSHEAEISHRYMVPALSMSSAEWQAEALEPPGTGRLLKCPVFASQAERPAT